MRPRHAGPPTSFTAPCAARLMVYWRAVDRGLRCDIMFSSEAAVVLFMPAPPRDGVAIIGVVMEGSRVGCTVAMQCVPRVTELSADATDDIISSIARQLISQSVISSRSHRNWNAPVLLSRRANLEPAVSPLPHCRRNARRPVPSGGGSLPICPSAHHRLPYYIPIAHRDSRSRSRLLVARWAFRGPLAFAEI